MAARGFDSGVASNCGAGSSSHSNRKNASIDSFPKPYFDRLQRFLDDPGRGSSCGGAAARGFHCSGFEGVVGAGRIQAKDRSTLARPLCRRRKWNSLQSLPHQHEIGGDWNDLLDLPCAAADRVRPYRNGKFPTAGVASPPAPPRSNHRRPRRPARVPSACRKASGAFVGSVSFAVGSEDCRARLRTNVTGVIFTILAGSSK
jgi:hypothetical protein